MSNKNTLTSANLIPLGIGIAVGGGLLFALITIWPLLILTGVGYYIHKGLPPFKGISGAKDAE